ncbi:MAG: FAD-binding protein [Chloroflexi bacterium]|nr:FAD-binding protein [Chloroflexota bacterium]
MTQMQYDVLVIGGGLAGCWAALRAGELTDKVLLVDIATVSKSGSSSFSGAGILMPDETDDLDIWQKEIVEKGQFLNDQDWVRVMLEEQSLRMADMGRWGLTFELDDRGKVLRHVGLNHDTTRIVTVDSHEMMEVLRRQLEARGIPILERTMMTRLLTSDGRSPTAGTVVGATGFHIRTGEVFSVNAGATVIASGSVGSLGGCGEGLNMAYLAGAKIFNVEFARAFDKSGFEGKYMHVHLNTYQRLGMRLINKNGERFMVRYLPDLMERGKREDLGLAIVSEGMQGRAPIYMDLRHLDENHMNKLYTLPSTTRVVNALKEEGIDFRTRPVEYVVTSGPITMRCGGIKINTFAETNLPGLYVAGEASGFPGHGTYSVGGVNLALCCVEGYRAGEFAARYARENGRRQVVPRQIKALVAQTFSPLKARAGLTPGALCEEIDKSLSPARVAVFRDAATIRTILEHVTEWKEQAARLQATDHHELMKANRMASYVQAVALIFRANLMREETRGNNIRVDFPYKDNIDWLKWVIQWADEERKPRIGAVPVPLYRYPVRPKEYTRIPANLPFPKNQ